ncbi:MAG TPA: NADH:flavin oxidoreductase/NADH oxidase [Terriglobales bacterium]|nr:NADH:flavin oxidoreductase/NADH oxidase [Terriglobales bacterium]
MHLFSPLKIRDVEIRNRIVVSPMCQYSSDDGFANDWHFVHLGSRAVGGAGLIITEAAAVEPAGRISPADLGIWKDEHIDEIARVVRFLEKHGAVAGIQLAHAGRKASTSVPWAGGRPVGESDGGWSPIFAPSAIAFNEESQTPEALDEGGIERTVRCFVDAARRSLEAGFRVLEIHGAHGYLLNEFLSPLTNKREDQYGGTFENRIRLACELTEAIRRVWPDRFPVFMRLSATDWAEGGWTVEDSIALARRLKSIGVDLIDCSSGGVVPHVRIPVGSGYQVRFAERIKREANILTGAVGMITVAQQADQIIRTEQADLVLLARQMLRDPYWPLHSGRVLGQDVAWAPQYLRARN